MGRFRSSRRAPAPFLPAEAPGIERLDGSQVIFTDGSAEEVDLLVWATGFRPSFPFLDSSYILDEDNKSKLFIHTFHRELDDFFVAGLFEPAEGGVHPAALLLQPFFGALAGVGLWLAFFPRTSEALLRRTAER